MGSSFSSKVVVRSMTTRLRAPGSLSLQGFERIDLYAALVQAPVAGVGFRADAQTFADRIVGVGLAIFGAGASFEEHAGSLPRLGVPPARGQVGPRAF